MRILQAFIANDNGGLTKYIVQNSNYLKQYEVECDFLTYEKKNLTFENDLIKEKAKVFHINKVSNLIRFYLDLKEIFKNNCYDIVHFNMSYVNFVPILIVKLLLPRKTKIVLHSHSMGFDENNKIVRLAKLMVHKIGRQLVAVLCDGFLSCSKEAGKWMFPQRLRRRESYQIAHNAIDITKFMYNDEVRMEVREEFGFDKNDIVIGHIGRFTYQKNHDFLVKIFQESLKKNDNYKLVLIGDGPNKEHIINEVKAYGMDKNVFFLGVRNDIPRLLQMMDVFCLPSRFEGLVIVGIEAQAAGLPCLMSDTISKDVAIDKCFFLSLNDLQSWVDKIDLVKNMKRIDTSEKLREAGYEITEETRLIFKYYQQIVYNC